MMRIFFLATGSRPAMGSTQPPIQLVLGDITPGVKQPVCEADHSLPSSASVKIAWNYTSILEYIFMAWCLIKQLLRIHGAVLS
jgi:hypothetical protein